MSELGQTSSKNEATECALCSWEPFLSKEGNCAHLVLLSSAAVTGHVIAVIKLESKPRINEMKMAIKKKNPRDNFISFTSWYE